jgi:hypothetical protein
VKQQERAEFVPHYMAMSPSPSALFAQLSDEEKVAIDLITHVGHVVSNDDERLATLVPAVGRRGYLRTLAIQLAACKGDPELDVAVAAWTAARVRYDEETRVAQRVRAEAAALDRVWLETLPEVVRRSVARQRRRRAARRGRRG